MKDKQLKPYTYSNNEPPDYIVQSLDFIGTCGSCPEQYDVVNSSGVQVGYIRLRGGRLSVVFPEVGGMTLFADRFEDNWKGCFDSEEERMKYLEIAATCINKQLRKIND
jgi:hypothetical protein